MWSTDVRVFACDFTAQLSHLAETEQHIRGRFSVPDNRTENEDRLIQACFDHRLFLWNRIFCHKKRHRLTWCPHLSSQFWTQIDYNTVVYRWSGSPIIPVHTCGLLCLRLVRGHTGEKTIHPAYLVLSDNYRLQLQWEISIRLLSQRNARNPSEHWKEIKEILRAAWTAMQTWEAMNIFNSWILTDPSLRTQHTIRRVDSWDVNWPTA